MRAAALLAVALLAGCPSKEKAPVAPAGAVRGSWMTKAAQGKEIYATLETSMGEVVLRLDSTSAPKTVENFVGLAAGEKPWTHPKTGEKSNKPLYDGTIFHRVIEGFMIQGGDPLGTGTGDPGYRFEDEFQSGRKFDKVGLLAMANAGPNTNGSQFFITTSTPAGLNNRHTIFGEVVRGYEVVEAISKTPRSNSDRPLTEVKINSVVLSDTAP